MKSSLRNVICSSVASSFLMLAHSEAAETLLPVDPTMLSGTHGFYASPIPFGVTNNLQDDGWIFTNSSILSVDFGGQVALTKLRVFAVCDADCQRGARWAIEHSSDMSSWTLGVELDYVTQFGGGRNDFGQPMSGYGGWYEMPFNDSRETDRYWRIRQMQELIWHAPRSAQLEFYAWLPTNQPPLIFSQPGGGSAYVGETIRLSITAFGIVPLAYQWRRDGESLDGKTNVTLTLTNLSITDTGDYTVMVTNAFGSATSAVARVTVAATGPPVTLTKAVKPSFSNLLPGHNYQIQMSGNLNTWTNYASPFTATDTNMVWTEYFDVDNWNSLFFRLQVSP